MAIFNSFLYVYQRLSLPIAPLFVGTSPWMTMFQSCADQDVSPTKARVTVSGSGISRRSARKFSSASWDVSGEQQPLVVCIYIYTYPVYPHDISIYIYTHPNKHCLPVYPHDITTWLWKIWIYHGDILGDWGYFLGCVRRLMINGVVWLRKKWTCGSSWNIDQFRAPGYK